MNGYNLTSLTRGFLLLYFYENNICNDGNDAAFLGGFVVVKEY
jgi:hypothetical protein